MGFLNTFFNFILIGITQFFMFFAKAVMAIFAILEFLLINLFGYLSTFFSYITTFFRLLFFMKKK